MNRGRIAPRPQSAVSYSNPNVFAPGAAGGAAGETRLANAAAGLLAGMSTEPLPLPNGLQPMTAILLAGALF